MKKEMKEAFEQDRDSPCRHDYKQHHFWKKVGVVYTNRLFLIWRCLQCHKVIWEPLEELALDDRGVPML
jgi:CRISPR/Cas system CMR-associated protein Cmr1 (group 7 of RAMP superfamily)